MPSAPAALVVLVAAWALGAAWLRGRLPEGATALERLGLRLAAGAALATGATLLLADLGWHRGWTTGALLGALALAGLAVNRRSTLPRVRPTASELVVLALAAALLAVALPPFSWELGGRDTGTFTNAAVLIADRHAVETTEPVLAAAPPEVRAALPLGGVFAGWYPTAPGAATTVPLGLHAWPALLAAVGYATGRNGLAALPAAAVIALLLAAALARRLAAPGMAGAVAGPVAAALLVAGVAFVWYARTPTTEMLALALTLGSLLAAALAVPTRSAALGALAGALAGVVALVRPDGLVVVVALVGGLAWAAAAGRGARAPAWGAGVALAVTGLVLVHAHRFAWTYYSGNWTKWGASIGVVAAIGGVIVGAVLVVLHRTATREPERLDALLARIALPAGVGAGGVLVLFLGLGRLAGLDGATWTWWYATVPGIALAAVGLGAALAHALRTDRLAAAAPTLALLALALASYGVDPRVTPDQLWAVRRLVGALLPLLAVLAAVGAGALWAAHRHRLPARIVAGGLVAATIALLAVDLVPTLGFVEQAGAARQLDRLDAALGPADTLVLAPWLNAPDGRYGVPLRVRYGRQIVPVTRLDSEPLAGWITAEAARRPVRVLALFGRLPPLPAGVVAAEEGKAGLDLPQWEQTVGGIPDREGRIVLPFTIYRLEPAGTLPSGAA